LVSGQCCDTVTLGIAFVLGDGQQRHRLVLEIPAGDESAVLSHLIPVEREKARLALK
jgi:hypothetical protein